MKQFFIFCILLSVVMAEAKTVKSIYGSDDRIDVLLSPNSKYKEWSRSSAAMIAKFKVIFSDDLTMAGFWSFPLGEMFELCPTERFYQQPSISSCSGFLVEENKILTAGHCVKNQDDCDNYYWAFDYQLESESATAFTLSTAQLYTCKKLIKRVEEDEGVDFALIELDKVVTDRSPLPLRKSGEIAVGDSLVVIGNPSGLATKIDAGGVVRSISPLGFFTTTLDTFAGNSGSAVINAQTGLVEGVLVRGDKDYVPDSKRECNITYQCLVDGCDGEDVTKIEEVLK